MIIVAIGGGKDSPFESSEDFERRLFGDLDGGRASDPLFRKLDRFERSFPRSNRAPQSGGDAESFDEEGEGFDSLSDGMDEELKKSCRGFFKHSDEIYEEDYAFRPDVHFREGDTYTVNVRILFFILFYFQHNSFSL